MYHYKAKVLSVIDGDTIDVQVSLGFNCYINERLRLLGVDTPEIKGSQRPEGLKVKEIVTNELLGKDITIRTRKAGSTDTYGRWLAAVYLEDGTCYNDSLIQRGLIKEGSHWNTGVDEKILHD